MSIKESDYDSFVARHQELEVNKLFRACVKLEAQRPAFESGASADGAR